MRGNPLAAPKKKKAKPKKKEPRNEGRNGYATNSFYRDFQKRTQFNRAVSNGKGLLELKDAHGNVIASCAEKDRRPVSVSFTPELGAEIAARYATGARLLDFLGSEGFPMWDTYVRWRMRIPEFNAAMEKALKMRAESYVAELEHLGDNVDAYNSKAGRVRADILKHLASVSDPDKFGARTKVVGDRNAPIAFTVVTGVPIPEGTENGPAPLPARAERADPGGEVPALPPEGSTGCEDPGAGGSAVDLQLEHVASERVGGGGDADTKAQE